MIQAPTGRRERKKLTTRRELRRAALRLALERGVDHVTVEDITDAVDVAPRTFFNYFASKEDALVAETPEITADITEAVASRPVDEAPLETMRAVLRQVAVASTSAERQEEAQLRHQLVAENPSLLPRQLARYAAVEHALASAMAPRFGGDPDDLRPALLAAVGVTVLRVSARRWHGDRTRSLGELVDEAFAALATKL